MSRAVRFELVTEVVSDDGQRARLDGAISVSTDCPLCGRHLVEADGTVRMSVATVNGSIRMVCQQPPGCRRPD